jgi:hypothetical protein
VIGRGAFPLDLLFRWFVGLGIDDPVWDHFDFLEDATGCSRAPSPPASLRRCSTHGG